MHSFTLIFIGMLALSLVMRFWLAHCLSLETRRARRLACSRAQKASSGAFLPVPISRLRSLFCGAPSGVEQ